MDTHHHHHHHHHHHRHHYICNGYSSSDPPVSPISWCFLYLYRGTGFLHCFNEMIYLEEVRLTMYIPHLKKIHWFSIWYSESFGRLCLNISWSRGLIFGELGHSWSTNCRNKILQNVQIGENRLFIPIQYSSAMVFPEILWNWGKLLKFAICRWRSWEVKIQCLESIAIMFGAVLSSLSSKQF